jgi:subtilisin family serine protease
VVDTRVNIGHPALKGQRIETIELTPRGYPKPRGDHGTAVVSLIAGRADGPVPGLLPNARVIAANPYFWSDRSGDLAEAMDVVRALDALVLRQVPVINMSLAGPDNQVLEEALQRVNAKGVVTVAAVGNAGPRAKPLFPAAYDPIISVTAVSDELSVYRRAGQGEHVDFSAPGVSLVVASGGKGTARKSGTSLAAPFLAASAAVLKTKNQNAGSGDIEMLLAKAARDLGPPGKDPVYGWGLVQAANLCRP